jgi:hypothetical protein
MALLWLPLPGNDACFVGRSVTFDEGQYSDREMQTQQRVAVGQAFSE